MDRLFPGGAQQQGKIKKEKLDKRLYSIRFEGLDIAGWPRYLYLDSGAFY